MMVVRNMESKKYKYRDEKEKQILQRRLKTIEGQVRGVSKMIEEDRYCDEVLIQISAIDKSLKSLGTMLLKNHLQTCVVKDIKNDHLEIIDDVMALIGKLS